MSLAYPNSTGAVEGASGHKKRGELGVLDPRVCKQA